MLNHGHRFLPCNLPASLVIARILVAGIFTAIPFAPLLHAEEARSSNRPYCCGIEGNPSNIRAPDDWAQWFSEML
jgi:hypothetical protein